MKRRLMESNQVGTEVRRIHIIYFLSRKGRIEHPHLIRVHHLSRNGVHLRDVKRWLSELRGKDMPESFAWSYKRRYKSGYVWQDLLDEDLITPISDNEYVLKGSEISSTIDSPAEKKYSMPKEEENSDCTPFSNVENQDHHPHHQEIEMEEEPTKNNSSPEFGQESPAFGSEKSSTLTDDSVRIEDQYQDQNQEKNSDYQSCKEEINEENDKIENPSFPSILSRQKSKKTSNATSDEKISSSSTTQPSFTRSKSYSNGASHLFRNLITCGAVDTKDSVTVMINRRNKPTADGNLSSSSNKQNQVSNATIDLLQKGDKLGGSQRIFGTNWNQQRQNSGRKSFDGVRASQKNKNEFNYQKANAAYKPIYGPPCSQCGKPFKPEKLHAHMKSCKGMKAWAKYSGPAISTNANEKTTEKSEDAPHDNLVSGYYLTH